MMCDLMEFPKTEIDPRAVKLQAEVTDFVTSCILKHELEFYQLVTTHFANISANILGTTCPSIVEMITETTNKFYNRIYYDIQHDAKSDVGSLVLNITELADYGPHILLEKLINLTLDVHLDIDRESLSLANTDLYQKSLLQQINLYLQSLNLIHLFAARDGDEREFVRLPEGTVAFNVVIDKNIGSSIRKN